MSEDLAEIMIRADASKERICNEFADVVRDLMRGIAAQEDYSGALYRATEKMDYLMKLVSACEEKVSWRKLFNEAIETLRPPARLHNYEEGYAHAAQSGLAMLTEMTCSDNAAQGRVSKRLDRFRSDMRSLTREK